MKKNCLLLTVIFIFLFSQLDAQLVNGCCFLQQNRIEVGIANNGSFGTPENAPVGYHTNNNPLFFTMYNPSTGVYAMRPNALGLVADYDSNGWSVGSPPFLGDYILPGTPQEGWALEINGIRSYAYSSQYKVNLNSGFTGSLTGSNNFVSSTPSITTSQWSGSMGALAITQTSTLIQDKFYLKVKVKFHNQSSSPLNDIYYMRTVDPDNDVAFTNNFNTINEIEYQLPNLEHKAIIGCTSTIDSNAYLALGAIDCRAKVFIIDSMSLFPPDTSLAILYANHPDLLYANSLTIDVGVGLIYNIGTILPGDSTEINFVYILNKNQVNEALEEIKPLWLNNGVTTLNNDTIFACANSIVPVSIVNNNNLIWNWSSTAAMSDTIGTTNNITLGVVPVSVTSVSTGACNDTIHLYIVPTSSVNSTVNASICSSSGYVYNGVTYTTPGTYFDTITTAGGCVNLVTINLSAGGTSSSTGNANICIGETYFFNGIGLNTTGIYFDTLVNSSGCDSLVSINLNVSYNNAVLNASICNGDSFLFNGMALYASGTYYDTLISIASCDTLLTLNLVSTLVDTAVSQTGSLLVASASSATYQWVDCKDYSPIPGATNQTFIGVNASYAVIVTQNGCTDTSSCYTVIPEDVVDKTMNPIIRILPNPNQGIFSLLLDKSYQNVIIELTDVNGRIIYNEKFKELSSTQLKISETKGLYFLTVIMNDKKYRVKVIKE